MDYNTQREKIKLREYGRWIQQMVEDAKKIEDKSLRTKQIYAILDTMVANTQKIADDANYKTKLWDYIYYLADYELDIDNPPEPLPVRKDESFHPSPIPYSKSPVMARHYGRNIQNMAKALAEMPDSEEKTASILFLAATMRYQYCFWNSDAVAVDQMFFDDLHKLSDGKITVPAGSRLPQLTESQRPVSNNKNRFNNKNQNWKKKKSK